MSDEYVNGAKQFIEFAFSKTSNSKIPCPCKKCVNYYFLSGEEVYDHLIVYGIMEHYTFWKEHGEGYSSPESYIHKNDILENVDMRGRLHEAFSVSAEDEELPDVVEGGTSGRNDAADAFFELLKDANQDLYLRCKKFSKLSFLVRLYHIKCLSSWTKKSFNMLLDFLKVALSKCETLSKSFYETKKIISEIGLNYEKIDACPNDCMLYWKEAANEEACTICGTSHWKIVGHHLDDEAETSSNKDRKIPAKILRYFPLVPRLRRLFMFTKMASLMRCHDEKRNKDGRLRHPAIGRALRDAICEGVVEREYVVVTLKLWGWDHDDPVTTLRQTLK